MDVTDRSSLPRRPRSARTERQPLPRRARDLPDLDSRFTETLDAGLHELGLALTTAQRAAIDDHVRLLIAWNAHINLSGLRDPEQIARGHVLDALLAVSVLRGIAPVKAGVAPSLLDIGSGGGFPGLPLAVALPARRAALVDSIAKKATFLDAAASVVTEALRAAPAADEAVADPVVPEIVALAERAEDLADEPDQREGWDLVLARAVGSVAECAELGLPLARRGGHVVIWKRASDAAARRSLNDEIAAARRVVQATGGAGVRVLRLVSGDKVGLPGSCLVIVRKVRPTSDRYPRSPGERRRGALP